MTEAKPSSLRKAAATLRRLRRHANLSVREMADALGYDVHTKYAYYESPRYKRDHLPLEFFVKVREVLMAHNVPEKDIDELVPEYFRAKLVAIDDRLERMERMMRQMVPDSAGASRTNVVRLKPKKSDPTPR